MPKMIQAGAEFKPRHRLAQISQSESKQSLGPLLYIAARIQVHKPFPHFETESEIIIEPKDPVWARISQELSLFSKESRIRPSRRAPPSAKTPLRTANNTNFTPK